MLGFDKSEERGEGVSRMGCFRNGGGRKMVCMGTSASYTHPEYWEHFIVTGNKVE